MPVRSPAACWGLHLVIQAARHDAAAPAACRLRCKQGRCMQASRCPRGCTVGQALQSSPSCAGEVPSRTLGPAPLGPSSQARRSCSCSLSGEGQAMTACCSRMRSCCSPAADPTMPCLQMTTAQGDIHIHQGKACTHCSAQQPAAHALVGRCWHTAAKAAHRKLAEPARRSPCRLYGAMHRCCLPRHLCLSG